MSDPSQHTHHRPWSLWTLSLLVILAGVYNLLLALDQVLNAGHYRDLGVSYPPLLRAAFALAWGMAFVIVGTGLVRRRQWARRWTLVVVSNYGAFSVLWLIVYAESDFSRGRIAFQAVVTAGVVGAVAWITRGRRAFRAEYNAEKSGD
jgi:hypothetical protein